MSTVNQDKGKKGTGDSMADRSAKSAVTRAMTAAKRSKLPPEKLYAHNKVSAARRSLEALADHILDGGAVSGDLLAACAALEGQVGLCILG